MGFVKIVQRNVSIHRHKMVSLSKGISGGAQVLLMRSTEEEFDRDSREESWVLWEELKNHLHVHIEKFTLSIFPTF